MTIHNFLRDRRGAASSLGTVALVLSAACAPSRAWGQQGEPTQCAAAARHLSAGRAERAIGTLHRCPSTGPQAVAAAWSRVGNHDAQDLESLAALSQMLQDGRVYQAALAAAEDAARPAAQRLAALSALVGIYKPGLIASTQYLTTAAVGDPLVRSMHPSTAPGEVPLPPSIAADLPALFGKLGASDPDSVIRGAAWRLRAVFAFFEPSHTPLEPGSVMFEACGAIVVMKWTTDVGLSLRVRVLGTDLDNTYTPTAASKDKPKQVALNLPMGTVVAFLGDREIARLEDRTAGCKSLRAQGIVRP